MEPILSDRYDRALLYGRRIHQQQIRKGSRNAGQQYYGIPYFSHPMAVSSLVLEYGGTENEAIAALLHDVLEDGPDFFVPWVDRSLPDLCQELTQEFGAEVVELVLACTQDPDPALDWYQTKQAYLDSLPHKSLSALLVSGADKLHNASAINRDRAQLGEEIWQRFRQGKPGAQWYYGGLRDGFCQECDRHRPDRRYPHLKALVDQLAHEISQFA
jgi:(p)ppGpp synthase/HD superfamily hydrolase